MTYTVVWKPAAERELAAIWNEASDRNSITAAAHQIDQLLRANPEEAGESRSGDIRILMMPPLVVRYKVESEDCRVSVAEVRRLKKRDQQP